MNRIDRKSFARHMRRCQNSYEELLWNLLRNRKRRNKKFRRQHPIGIYTVDFYCAQEKLVVELDGVHHMTEAGRKHDLVRDQFMASLGIRVLRFTGKQLEFETEAVIAEIDKALNPSSPTPFSPEYRGEGE